ncbi:MAG: alpha/beta hydrolase, partial [Pseudomonadota bacterium]
YGGPVALKLAAEAPELISGLVLVAAAVDPELEEMKWYQHVAKVWGVRSLVPDDLDVCNREILLLKGELEKLEKVYSQISLPVEVIQGTSDKLVPKENVDYLKKHLRQENTNYTVQKGMRHFVPWAFPGLIEDAIVRIHEGSKGSS